MKTPSRQCATLLLGVSLTALGCTTTPAGESVPQAMKVGAPDTPHQSQEAPPPVVPIVAVPGVHSYSPEQAAAGLVSGDPEAWGRVAPTWFEPWFAACQAWHVSSEIPDNMDDLWPYLFTWPANAPNGESAQRWTTADIPSISTAPPWSAVSSNDLAVSVQFVGPELVIQQPIDVNGKLNKAEGKVSLDPDGLLHPRMPVRNRGAVAPIATGDPTTVKGFRGAWSYAMSSIEIPEARLAAAREAILNLVTEAVTRSGTLPQEWNEMQRLSGLVPINLQETADPDSASLALFTNGDDAYLLRVRYAPGIIEEGVITYENVAPFAARHRYQSLEEGRRTLSEFSNPVAAWNLGESEPLPLAE